MFSKCIPFGSQYDCTINIKTKITYKTSLKIILRFSFEGYWEKNFLGSTSKKTKTNQQNTQRLQQVCLPSHSLHLTFKVVALRLSGYISSNCHVHTQE